MFVQKFQVQNFKSLQDITIYFNKDVNVLTGKNNSGKTTVLEAISLWQECFTKLITQAIRNQKVIKKEIGY
jgi:AAA15 family ATPase/GTPase